MDTLAPPKQVTMVSRRKTPWFDDELKGQRNIVCNRERVYMKYKTDSTWKAFKHERNCITYLLQYKHRKVMTKKILDCENDTRKLYQLVNNVTGLESENPMPEGKTDQELANSFTLFFNNKILSLRDMFVYVNPYQPEEKEIPQLRCFSDIPQSEVLRTANTKSCELDAKFCSTWKTAIVRPLIKKIGLDLVDKNYRPVSNHLFLNYVKGVCWINLIITVDNTNYNLITNQSTDKILVLKQH